MKKLMFAVVACVSLLFVSCDDFREVEFHGIDSVQVEKSDKEKIAIVLNAKVYNPNSFTIKIKPSTFDMKVGDKTLGQAKITEVTKLKKLEKANYPIKLEAKWKDLLGGGLGGVLGVLTKQKLDLTIKGDLTVGAFGISKKVPIDHTKSIDLKSLKGGE